MLSVEFLEANGFRPFQYSDGLFYIRHYSAYEHYIQVSDDLVRASECFDGWVTELTTEELLTTIDRHNKAINQNSK